MSEKVVSPEVIKSLGILPEEYKKIQEILGRDPNFTELSIFSVMWSEHASYKNSIKWLKTLPKKGPHVLAEAGEENAGLIDLGDGLACAFKIESHNHPSAIEPYQGAATGVGGINRDIFTMGARPIAQLNSLRFGNLQHERSKWHLKGVVKGIGDYGNAFGVPVVGGEIYFDDCYLTNPLVNAMSVGIVDKNKTISATASGIGNPVYIVGSSTGKDGIHGATFASADLNENSSDDIPSVQVGDPFMEKLLMEASLEMSDTQGIAGMQDMGAAGIICSTSEMSARGKVGMKVWLDKVPLRQQNIDAWEILLSESQERMLVVVKKGYEKAIETVLEKWDLHYAIIGEVIDEDKLYFYMNDKLVAEVPADALVLGGGAPVYEREYKEPAYYQEYKKFDIANVPEPSDLSEVISLLVNSHNIASKRWIYEQYDSMVGTRNMSTNFPSDAGVVNLKGTNKALVMTVDCNSRYVHADPFIGTEIAVCEAARNIICSGGEPAGVTNCLNFGNPYSPEVYWQFVHAIKGMTKACEKLQVPVTGGNVSFYNQTAINGKVEPVFPTPTIGMVGILQDKTKQMSLAFREKGDMLYLIGPIANDIASSEYLVKYHKITSSPAPKFDLETEIKVQEKVLGLIKDRLIVSAHDISEGGLFISMLESGLPANLGFDITTCAEVRTDAFLFGESQSRILVSVMPCQDAKFVDVMTASGLPFMALGHVTKGEIRIDDISYGHIGDLKQEYNTAIEKML
ncbi:MAG: phosphoribosylformylglycinamidine synthase subunit PurL [Bacteroidetes bacterium HGW-Bacteroidetes-21]|nr:MAG: phosphoribosylformylglycinamidine synthase subunit PurL [Bacteroidetes bacterium HGW-Bacteroidetes-21]